MNTVFINEDERYGDPVQVTVEDYRELNPDGRFAQDEDGIYEDGVRIAVPVIAADTDEDA